MNPAPPVTRTLRVMARLQPEQFSHRLQQAVPASGPRRLLQRDRGVVQELVEEGVAEQLQLPTVLRREVSEPLERALELRRADVLEPLAEFLQHGYEGEPAVPPPEPLDLRADDAFGRWDFAAPLRRDLRRDGLEVVDVVQEYVLELAHRRFDVARDGEIQ